MAVCGSDFFDEKKEDFKALDHSLEKVVAFSTCKKQICGLSKEGLLHRLPGKDDEFQDRRIKIDYSKPEFRFNSFWAVHMKARVRSGTSAVGSGDLIAVNGKGHLLTCAHNVCAMSSYHRRLVQFKDVNVYACRDGVDKWSQLFKLVPDGIIVHPKYNDDPACGFDIAVAQLRPVDHVNNGTINFKTFADTIWHCADPKSLKAGTKIQIAGYPGEMKGYPYYHSGEIKDVKEQTGGGWTLFYDVDSSPGMSGSPIKVTDKEWLKEHLSVKQKKEDITKMIIGIHTGHDNTVMLNYGTLITPALSKWITTNKDNTGSSKEESSSWFGWIFGTS